MVTLFLAANCILAPRIATIRDKYVINKLGYTLSISSIQGRFKRFIQQIQDMILLHVRKMTGGILYPVQYFRIMLITNKSLNHGNFVEVPRTLPL